MVIPYQLYDLHVFSSNSVGWVFTLWIVSFDAKNILHFDQVQFIFSFVALRLVSCLRNHCLLLGHEDFHLFPSNNFMVPEALCDEGPASCAWHTVGIYLCLWPICHTRFLCPLSHQTHPATKSQGPRSSLAHSQGVRGSALLQGTRPQSQVLRNGCSQLQRTR